MSTKTVHGIAGRYLNPPLKVSHTLFTAVEASGYKAVGTVQKGKILAFFRPDASEAGIMSSGNDERIIERTCDALSDAGNRLVVLHIAAPDYYGHKHGWLTEEQYQGAEKVSGYLQALRACIDDADRAGTAQTTLIVTTDHGGTPGTTGHGRNDADNRLVPLAIIGPGVIPGHRLTGQPRLVDVSATVLHILGIPMSSIPTLSGTPIVEAFARP
jgi:phosphopentomutase